MDETAHGNKDETTNPRTKSPRCLYDADPDDTLAALFATVRHNVFALLRPCPVLRCAASPFVKAQRLKRFKQGRRYKDPFVFPPPVQPSPKSHRFGPSLPKRTDRTPSE
ncbi:hypothetical protein FSST1_007593 [Fusarium sambucinum]